MTNSTDCTSHAHPGPMQNSTTGKKKQSLTNPEHFYAKTEQDTETAKQKPLNNTLVTTNEG